MNITVTEGKMGGGLDSVATHRHLVCWRSTIAGFFIAAMTFADLRQILRWFNQIESTFSRGGNLSTRAIQPKEKFEISF